MKRHVYSETLTEPRHGPREQSCVEETELRDDEEEEEGLWKYLGSEGDCHPESFPRLRKTLEDGLDNGHASEPGNQEAGGPNSEEQVSH
ncbi:hypothetical protein INR49_001626 [Caranx melampygus]|nr:hypothetical protein INR49_001626 [Caranx melampygus]